MQGSDRYETKGYEDLAIAIVTVAAEDYRAAYRRYKRGDESAKKIIQEIETFFRSEYGDLLCSGKADKILQRLQKEQEEKPIRTVKITKRETNALEEYRSNMEQKMKGANDDR